MIFTICVIAIGIAGYWWMFYSAGFSAGRDDFRSYVASEHYARDAAKKIKRECSARPSAARLKCIRQIVETEHETKRGESDLAAQWEAAEWARWAGIIAAAQLIATIVGLWYVKGTLDATWEAVEDTRSVNTNIQAANELEFRAWIDFELNSVEVTISDKVRVTPYITVTNIGRSPATFVTCDAAFMLHGVFFKIPDLSKALDALVEKWENIPERSGEAVFPGKEHDMSYPATCVNESMLSVYKSEPSPIWITLAIRVFYNSFGVARSTDHYFNITKPKGRFAFIDEGLDPNIVNQEIEFRKKSGGVIT